MLDHPTTRWIATSWLLVGPLRLPRRRAARVSQPRRVLVATLVLLVVLAAAGRMPAAAAPQAGFLQTVSDFLSLGANTAREIQEAIRLASGEAKTLLEQIKADVSDLLGKVSETYQANLYVTIDSLDQFTRNKLLELQRLFEKVAEMIRETIMQATAAVLEILRQASLEIRRVATELKRDLEEVILVGGLTGIALIDRAANNMLTIGAFTLLAVGLLLFVWLLFSRRVPIGGVAPVAFGLAVVYLVVVSSLAFWPAARAYALSSAGIGIREQLESVTAKPHILDVFPQVLVPGVTKELQVWGSGLRLENVTPIVQLQALALTPRAATNEQLVLDVSGVTLADGSYDLVLQYAAQEGPRTIVRVARAAPPTAPPDLVVSGFSIDPASPVRGGYLRALVTVANLGAATTKAFEVRWKPTPTLDGLVASVPGLAAGALKTVPFEYAYGQAGSFDSLATVDAPNDIAESNELNNTRMQRVTVNDPPPQRARVTVTFTQVTVHEIAKGLTNGQMWLTFNINGQKLRWPTLGSKLVDNGASYTVGLSHTRDLAEGEPLSILVTGWVGASLFINDDAVLGTLQKSYQSSAQWGKGVHSERSTCPVGCYELHFRIDVVRL